MINITLFYILIILIGLYKYFTSIGNRKNIIYITLLSLFIAYIFNFLFNKAIGKTKQESLLSIIVDESKLQPETFQKNIKLAKLPINLDNGLSEIIAMNDSIILRNQESDINIKSDKFNTKYTKYQLVGLLLSSTNIAYNNIVYKSWNKNYVDDNKKKIMYHFIIRSDGSYYLLHTSFINPANNGAKNNDAKAADAKTDAKAADAKTADANSIDLITKHLEILDIYDRSKEIENEHFDPVIKDIVVNKRNGYVFVDILDDDTDMDLLNYDDLLDEDKCRNSLNIRKNMQKNMQKIDSNYFGIILPKDDKFLYSTVTIITNNGKITDKFMGEPLYFKLEKNISIINKININTPNDENYVQHNKNINTIFAIIPIKSTYPNSKFNNIIYKLGNKKAQPCNKINLLHSGNIKNAYRANYSNGVRGVDYYGTNVNEYKAPIYVGTQKKDGGLWKEETCVLKYPYTAGDDDFDETIV